MNLKYVGWYWMIASHQLDNPDLDNITVAVGPLETFGAESGLPPEHVLEVKTSADLPRLVMDGDTDYRILSPSNYDLIRDNVQKWAEWCSNPLAFLTKPDA